jgi:putative hydrolase of the HAD superfamily
MLLNEERKVRALLVDLDGVLRLWPRTDAALERSHGLPEGALRAAAFEPELLLEAIEGRISDGKWRETVESRLLEKYPNAEVAAAVSAWSAPIGTVSEPALNLVQRVRQSAPIVLVTNATSRLDRDLEALGLPTHFDAVINSSVVQSAKPSAGIYAAALEAAGVAATEALFVDDQVINVTAAAKLGINAHHFTTHEALSACLHACGLLHGAA